MYRAGDLVTITDGELKGRTGEIVAVRMFATDNGYYLKGVEGLIPPSDVVLVQERAGGNPCGAECDPGPYCSQHTCDHCRGVCLQPYGVCRSRHRP